MDASRAQMAIWGSFLRFTSDSLLNTLVVLGPINCQYEDIGSQLYENPSGHPEPSSFAKFSQGQGRKNCSLYWKRNWWDPSSLIQIINQVLAARMSIFHIG